MRVVTMGACKFSPSRLFDWRDLTLPKAKLRPLSSLQTNHRRQDAGTPNTCGYQIWFNKMLVLTINAPYADIIG